MIKFNEDLSSCENITPKGKSSVKLSPCSRDPYNVGVAYKREKPEEFKIYMLLNQYYCDFSGRVKKELASYLESLNIYIEEN